jgi:hypothetical protein
MTTQGLTTARGTAGTARSGVRIALQWISMSTWERSARACRAVARSWKSSVALKISLS